MKWTITQLQKYRNKGLVLSETIDVSEIKEIDKQIREVSPITVTGRVDINSNNININS